MRITWRFLDKGSMCLKKSKDSLRLLLCAQGIKLAFAIFKPASCSLLTGPLN